MGSKFREEYDTFAKENCIDLEWDITIQVGDLYIAKRNTGFHLLTCKEVDMENGYIRPVEAAYPYNISECVKVKS